AEALFAAIDLHAVIRLRMQVGATLGALHEVTLALLVGVSPGGCLATRLENLGVPLREILLFVLAGLFGHSPVCPVSALAGGVNLGVRLDGDDETPLYVCPWPRTTASTTWLL